MATLPNADCTIRVANLPQVSELDLIKRFQEYGTIQKEQMLWSAALDSVSTRGCFVCGAIGHIGEKCNADIFVECEVCGRAGHTMHRCQLKSKGKSEAIACLITYTSVSSAQKAAESAHGATMLDKTLDVRLFCPDDPARPKSLMPTVWNGREGTGVSLVSSAISGRNGVDCTDSEQIIVSVVPSGTKGGNRGNDLMEYLSKILKVSRGALGYMPGGRLFIPIPWTNILACFEDTQKKPAEPSDVTPKKKKKKKKKADAIKLLQEKLAQSQKKANAARSSSTPKRGEKVKKNRPAPY